ncbi:MAG: hypothetical protein QOF78_1107 [Phycisphaerales bacterium]|nr:hypothetical protein [Phycisphaerales bacterium]
MLEYARPRPRFGVHLPTAIVAALVLLALNIWPHFVTSVIPSMADVPEPELGWPWVFFFYGQMVSGHGPLLIWEQLAYDLVVAAFIVVGAGHAACRMTKHCTGPGPERSL